MYILPGVSIEILSQVAQVRFSIRTTLLESVQVGAVVEAERAVKGVIPWQSLPKS